MNAPDPTTDAAKQCPALPPQTQPTEPPNQEELLRRYQEQQARLACPGCGESPFLG